MSPLGLHFVEWCLYFVFVNKELRWHILLLDNAFVFFLYGTILMPFHGKKYILKGAVTFYDSLDTYLTKMHRIN